MVMASDRYQPWDIEAENLKETCDDLATNLLERKRLLSRGLNTSDIDRQISTALSNIKTGITSLESELSAAESKCAVPTSELKKWEQTILALSKQYDRLEFLAKTDDRSTDTRAQLLSARQPHSSATPSSTILSSPLTVDEGLPLGSLNNHEVLQLQERVIQEQDSHLDELAETIGRQRQIGLLISDELDLHADLLEEVDEAVDRTRSRLGVAGRRLNAVTKDAKTCGVTSIFILFIVLVIVIVLARK
ncbi:hypothetical protein SeMB42_g03309 [Synchytrium endobioticum]|uniref:t-SNARE coiled-coil homology domain-containing protein n=1 Tax=Synchytrium endobioticum TaxID=286115 RepID=A0A507D778_9FUNG|nr:hypothetical protein SeMB42_g03309 [Synchytrium endobioticum]